MVQLKNSTKKKFKVSQFTVSYLSNWVQPPLVWFGSNNYTHQKDYCFDSCPEDDPLPLQEA